MTIGPLTVNSTGGVVALGNGDKFVVQGETLLVNGIGGYMDGWGEPFPLDQPVALLLSRFIGLDGDTLAPEYAAAVTVQAQVKNERVDHRWRKADTTEGPDMPETRKVLYLQEANTSQTWPLIRIELGDVGRTLMVPDLYTVKYLPPPTITTPGDPELGIPAEVEPGTPLLLDPTQVNINEQIVPVGNQMIRRGDACMTVPRNGLTEDMLMNPEARFEITLPGGAVVLYQVPGKEGFETLLTYHYKIYLNRLRP